MPPIFPGSTTGGGNCLAAPDVCIVPVPPPSSPVPTPFPNTAMMNQAQKTSMKVKFVNKEVVVENSEIPQSQGDEAGSNGGVTSGSVMGKVTVKLGSQMVKAEGKPVAYLTSLTQHNGANANAPAGAQIAPSQTKVIVAP